MTIVLHRHCRELGYCNRGLREWFAREGLDWADFLKHGIAAERLRACDNAMAERAIALAEREAHGQQ
jgi:hypothetical protein